MDPFIVRNLVYGLEDSFISTTGVLVGISFAGLPRLYVIITGIVLIFCEASSMAFGAFVSEESFLLAAKTPYTLKQVFEYATIMFLAYTFAGIAVMLPYILRLPNAPLLSIAIAIAGLFTIIQVTQQSVRKATVVSAAGGGILAFTIVIGRVIDKWKK